MNCKDAVRDPISGRVTLWMVDPASGLWLPRFRQDNQIQATWGHIAARQIGFKRPHGRLDYSISAMYFEFENMVNAEDAVDIPTYDVDEGTEYYHELLNSATRDFLRIPLTLEPTLGIESDFDVFTPGIDGNKLTFFGQTAGVLGHNGKSFSNASNSKVFGAALVATPVANDYTQDVIFSRTYFALDDQVVKPLSHQIQLQWDLIFATG